MVSHALTCTELSCMILSPSHYTQYISGVVSHLQERRVAGSLISHGQDHVFKAWPKAGEMRQIIYFDSASTSIAVVSNGTYHIDRVSIHIHYFGGSSCTNRVALQWGTPTHSTTPMGHFT